ncbi:HAD-IC family P-type ATPase [Laceyella putida]|uniref:HAD-IC family P-type ATPase n=1 Tax=Laceyella putida TaxID=110101 RepID=A0ABW2RKV9_9BACL
MKQTKQRYIRIFPGHLRAEVAHLQDNPTVAQTLVRELSTLAGVQQIKPCITTGRVLIQFDCNRVSVEQICNQIQTLEQTLTPTSTGLPPACHVSTSGRQAQAEKDIPSVEPVLSSQKETVDSKEIETPKRCPERINSLSSLIAGLDEVAASQEGSLLPISIPDSFQHLLAEEPNPSTRQLPLGLAVTLGGLVFLGAKQWLFGKSAIARHPALFALSGILSVVTGYPFLRKGIRDLGSKRHWNADLILGTAALGLGLMRENLLSLAGLGILQYVHWKREQSLAHTGVDDSEAYLSPEIKRYAQKMSKWAFPIAGASWAITRDPLVGLAVLLAMNPRPTIMPTIAAWKQAESDLAANGGTLPVHGSLAQCAHAQTVLVEDTAQLFEASEPGLRILSPAQEEGRLWMLAASLVAKTKHPWRKEMEELARQTKHTTRTAFHVREETDGICGEINQQTYYLGTLSYMQKHRIAMDPLLLKCKRLQKQGTEHAIFVRKKGNDVECLGILYKENHPPSRQLLSLTKHLQRMGRSLAVLNNSLGIEAHVLERFQIDATWLLLNKREQLQQLLQSQSEPVLLALNDVTADWTDLNLPSPIITQAQLKGLPEMLEKADHVQRQINKQFAVTRWFNLIGVCLAIPFKVSAMMVNLLADALSLIFFARVKPESASLPFTPAAAEVSAALAKETTPLSPTASIDWHALSVEEVVNYFGVNPKWGLHPQQEQEYRRMYGKNALHHQTSPPWWKSYLGQFKEFTSLLLLGTTLISFLTGDAFNGVAILAVLLVNAAIGTIQERKAEQVVEALNQYQAPSCTVLRDGKEQVITGEEVVPGDLVLLEAGHRVPADLRVIDSWNAEVDESMLTGESIPVAKHSQPLPASAPLAERGNMLYKGTGISRGRAIGVVVATGMETEMGHLMSLMNERSQEATPLQQEVASISKTFVLGALGIALAIFGVGLLRGNPILQMIPVTIALAASAIPEGLPVTVTIALSAGIFRMAKKHTLIRKLSTLETLGRATVICTDKTGTLTKNEMTVRKAATLSHTWDVTGEGYQPQGELVSETSHSPEAEADLSKLVQVATLCNNTQLIEQDGTWTIQGDPTEGALLTFAHKTGVSIGDPTCWRREHEIPFDSETAKMSVVCREADKKQDKLCYVLTKGSIESVLKQCAFAQINGQVVPLTEQHKQRIAKLNEAWAQDSLRVLAFSYRPIDWDGNRDGIENDSIFVGLVGMIDPPKPGIDLDIQQAIQLGARPVMITGDHPTTAYAIAKEIGLSEEPLIMTGNELDRLTDEELKERIGHISVFARVTPEHKLRIVQMYQHLGHIVAMTGDGINDTPAIKQANVGIAMGQTGTEVTKETADMVLEKDDFGSIVEGIKEGRTIVSNIRQALGCLLTGNLAEILVTGISVITGLPLPLIPIQILLMNLLTDALPAMVLAMNPDGKNQKRELGRIADRSLYAKVLLSGTLLGVGSLGLFIGSLASGIPLPIAQTIAFSALVVGQLVQTFFWRNQQSDHAGGWMKDRFLLGSMAVSALALLSAVYLPPLQAFFHTAPLTMSHWGKILLMTLGVAGISKILYPFLNRPASPAGPPILQSLAA